MGTLRRRCAMPQPSELRFTVVRAVDLGIAVLDWGPRRARGRGGYLGGCSPFSQWEMQLGCRCWVLAASLFGDTVTKIWGIELSLSFIVSKT